MLSVYRKELRSYFTGAVGYVFLGIYLAVAAAVFLLTTVYAMSASVTNFYVYMMLACGVLLPLLTMKSFSEERKLRTEQLLLTAPVSLTGMVMGKFLAAYTVFAGVEIFTSMYFLFLAPFAQLKAAVWLGNILALLLVGMTFIAIGTFVSALTENQLSAAVGTIGIILGFLAVGLIGNLIPSKYWIRFVLDCLSVFARFRPFANGYFDFSSVIYYLSVSAVFLYLTVRVYDRRRNNG